MPGFRRRRRDTDVSVDRVYGDDVYVRVSTIGIDGDRPFVLVPGIGVASNYYERLAPNLNEFGPVHALDLPGFGGVPHAGKALTIRQYADLVGMVIDRLELNDPVLVGHSMGTQVVTDLAARRPDLSTLVLISPVVNAPERRVPSQALRFLQSAWHEPWRVKFLALSSYVLCGVKWFSRILPEMMNYRIEDQLPAVRASTLLIRGEFDYNCTAEWAERMANDLPHSRAWEVPGAAHSVMYAHAEEVARLCVEHVHHPVTTEGHVTLQRVQPDPTDDDQAPDGSFEALGGQLTEMRGILTNDDDLIAKGKTQHAEALEAEDAEDDGRSTDSNPN